jgi:hypothetical protein
MPTKKTAKKVTKFHEESAFVLPETPVVTVLPVSNKKKIRWIISITLTAIIIVGTSLNLFLHYQNNQVLKKNPVLASEMEQETIVSKVGKLMELPNVEQPTIATVSDITKLKGQSFFQNAKNGDIVLIYPKADEAILYDPTVNKILKTGSININSQTATPVNGTVVPVKGTVAGASTQAISVTPTIGQQVTVALYNGTTIDGLTRKVQTELTQSMPNVTVVQNTNASKHDYKQTIVVDLSGTNLAAAEHLASLLNGTVGNFPSTETVPVNSEIVVILGSK